MSSHPVPKYQSSYHKSIALCNSNRQGTRAQNTSIYFRLPIQYARLDVRRFLLIRIVDARTLERETSRCRSIPLSRGPPALIIAEGGERRGVPHLTPTWSAELNSDSVYGWTLSLRATPYHCPIMSFCHQNLYSCSLILSSHSVRASVTLPKGGVTVGSNFKTPILVVKKYSMI